MGPGLDRGVREALAIFADELSAHRYLERMLWPDGVRCPRCASARVGKLNGASTRLGTYKCYGCRKAFSLLHGTMMAASHVPAHKWLQAIYLTECGTRPMSTHHLQQILNVTFKTASSMMRRICEAAGTSAFPGKAPGSGIGIARLADVEAFGGALAAANSRGSVAPSLAETA
jgi:transposase-like protein